MIGQREERIAVPASLAPWVASITELRRLPGEDERLVRLPDASVSIVVRRDPHGALKLSVVGPTRQAFYKSSAGIEPYTRITFHVGQARRALGVSPRELADSATDLAALWGQGVEALVDAASLSTYGKASLIDPVAGLLARRLAGAPSFASTIAQRAAVALAGTDDVESAPIRRVAARLGVSERFLRKAFHDEVGVSPKHYARFERIGRVARAAARVDLSLAILASSHGFFDQSHLNAEFRALLRITPTAFRAGSFPASTRCG